MRARSISMESITILHDSSGSSTPARAARRHAGDALPASVRRAAAARRSSIPPRVSSAIWPRPRPSSWRASCGKRHAPSRRKSPPRSAPIDGISRVDAAPNGYLNVYLDRAAVRRTSRAIGRPTPTGTKADPGPCPARRSSSTRPSIPTRRRISATSETRRSATRWCACSASAASLWKCRTTSTTPACRWPTSSSASASSSTRAWKPSGDIADSTRFDYSLLGSLRARHALVRGRQGAAEDSRGHAARHRAWRQRKPRRMAQFIATRIVALPPEDNGAAEYRLRPADVGRPHPAAAVLGHAPSRF